MATFLLSLYWANAAESAFYEFITDMHVLWLQEVMHLYIPNSPERFQRIGEERRSRISWRSPFLTATWFPNSQEANYASRFHVNTHMLGRRPPCPEHTHTHAHTLFREMKKERRKWQASVCTSTSCWWISRVASIFTENMQMCRQQLSFIKASVKTNMESITQMAACDSSGLWNHFFSPSSPPLPRPSAITAWTQRAAANLSGLQLNRCGNEKPI